MKNFLNLLLNLFATKTEQPKSEAPKKEPTAKPPQTNIGSGTIQEKVYAIAKKELGVKELLVGSNKTVEKYHAYSTKDNKVGTTDDVPWCASFVCYCLETAGLNSTNSKSARSYEAYGKPTKSPVFGDIVVFYRGTPSSGKGHVAFFSGYDSNGNIKVLGGNQHDEVCIASYDKSRLVGFRTY